MAESLTAGGAVAAVSQLTGELVKLTTNLRHHLKVMRRAPDEVQGFLMEISNFTCLLNFFSELADRPAQNTEKKEQRKRERMVVEIQQQCIYIRDKMEYLVDRFAVLAKGNMTPLEGLLERIRYLLDKPDIRDLRLSLQISALTVNCMTTLFAWEEATMKDNTRAVSLLEQLKNLLPMAKKASSELAEYQRKHGTRYESGMPGPNNAMLAASEEVLRQIAHAIRPYSHSETAARDRLSGGMRKEKRRVSPVAERSSHSGSWDAPIGPDGLVDDSVEYSPRRRQNRVSFKTSDNAMDLHVDDCNLRTTYDNDVIPTMGTPALQLPPDKPLSIGSNGASYISGLDTGGTSFGKGKQVAADEVVQGSVVSSLLYEVRPKPRREDYILEVPDPTKPRVHPRIRRSHSVFCATCNEAHSPEKCPERSKRTSKDKIIQNTGDVSPMPGISARTSREDTRSSPVEQAHYTLPVPTESEASGQSGRDADNPRWSRTSLPLPSSKSSSPSTQGDRSPTAKRQNSKAVRAADVQNELRETRDSKTEKERAKKRQTWIPSTNKSEKERELGQEQQHDTLAQGSSRQPDETPKEEQQQQPVFKAYRPGVLENRDVAPAEERPAPGPPSGRRRPRRPRPNTMML